MPLFKLTAALVATLALNAAAFALDPSPAVKATTILKTSQSWDGKPLAYPAGQAEITGMIIEIAPGAETGWHLHPVPSFGMVLEGELEVRLKNGATNRLKAGDTLAEVVDTLHNGRNIGAGTVKLAIFYAGAVDGKLTVKEPAAAQ